MEQAQRLGQPLPEKRVVQLILSVCQGLRAMHTASPHPLAHRDIKVHVHVLCIAGFFFRGIKFLLIVKILQV